MMKKTSIKMFLRKNLFFLLFLFTAVIVLQSCYPYDDIDVNDADVVATFYDDGANFANLVNYAMSDTIYTFGSGSDNLVPSEDISSTNANAILNSIKTNLANMGFVDKTSAALTADSLVFVAAIVTSSTWVSGGCYGGYWSYWYPYYGWCYPVAYTYTTGTILIVMAEKQASSTNGVWVAGINGILNGTASNTSRINADINQAFQQSPYLGDGK
jgi:hypothetical protein